MGSDHSIRNVCLDCAIAACVVAAIGMLLPLPSFFELYHDAPGSSVRPIGPAVMMFLAGVGTPVIVWPLGICAAWKSGASRFLGLLAIALSVIPLPAYFFAFRWIVETHMLDLKP
jgi:hypothetical protein